MIKKSKTKKKPVVTKLRTGSNAQKLQMWVTKNQKELIVSKAKRNKMTIKDFCLSKLL